MRQMESGRHKKQTLLCEVRRVWVLINHVQVNENIPAENCFCGACVRSWWLVVSYCQTQMAQTEGNQSALDEVANLASVQAHHVHKHNNSFFHTTSQGKKIGYFRSESFHHVCSFFALVSAYQSRRRLFY